jgi:glycerol-3-phosphate acyltransferase PlsY
MGPAEMIVILKILFILLICYLIGSVPFSYIFTKLQTGDDIRKLGSGNAGATNASRVLGRWYGMTIGVLDFTKGLFSVFLAGFLMGTTAGTPYIEIGPYALGALGVQVLAGFAAITGHLYPVFLGFRGGKGVATFFGSLSALCPLAGLVGGEVFFLIFFLYGFVSLGSIAAVASTYVLLIPMIYFYGFPLEYIIFTLVGTIVVAYKHRENIKRLLSGQERSARKKKTA